MAQNTFQKQRRCDAVIKNSFIFACRGGNASDDNTQKKDMRAKFITKEIIPVIDKYYHAQNDFDKMFLSEEHDQRQQAKNRLVDILLECTLQSQYIQDSPLSNDAFRQYRYKCAKNTSNSICCEMIILEDALYSLSNNNLNDENIDDVQATVNNWQKRFKNYQYNSTEPVDQNSDLFLSYIAPVLMSYYGVEVNKSFTDGTISLLEEFDLEIPTALKALQKKEKYDNLENFDKTVEYKGKSIKEKFEDFGILDAFLSVDTENDRSLLTLCRLTEAFMLTVNPKFEDLSDISANELLTKYAQIIWEQVHKKTTDKSSVTQQVIHEFHALSEEEKLGEKGKLYNILKQTGIAQKQEIQRLEEEEKLEQEKQQKKQEELTKEVKEEEKQNNEIKEEVSTISYKEAMLKLAKHLFLNQKEYDEQSLKDFYVLRTMKSFDDVITFEFHPFEEALSFKEENAMALVEKYQKIKENFLNLGLNAQKEFLMAYTVNGKSFEEITKEEYQNMLKNYGKQPKENRKMLMELSTENTQVNKEVEEAQNNFNSRVCNRKSQIQKYLVDTNIDFSNLGTKEEEEQSIIDFFSRE